MMGFVSLELVSSLVVFENIVDDWDDWWYMF